MNNLFLKNQLKDLGASKDESRQLADLANELNSITPSLSKDSKNRIADEVGFKPTHDIPKLRLGLAGAMAIFVVLIVLAQSAMPGSVLYALKRGSEEVRVLVQPGFDDEDIRQRRDAEQIKVKQQIEVEDKSDRGDDESDRRDGDDDSNNKSEDSPKSEDSNSKSSDESGLDSDRSGSDSNRSNDSRSDDSRDD